MEMKVLIVDDNALDRLLAGSLVEQVPGWKVSYAADGREALAAIERDPPHVVLTDMQMPEMDGLELVEAVRSKYPLVPVVLMTSHGNEEHAMEALQHGAASFLPKKFLYRDIMDVLERVLELSKAERNQQRLFEYLTRLEFHFDMENDPALIPVLVAHFQPYHVRLRLADQAGKLRLGIALEEALLNALYHGNLEVSSDLRQDSDEPFYRLAEQRRHESPYRERRVRVSAVLSHAEARYIIANEGPGFDPNSLPDPSDPANLVKSSGRGLLLIRTFMDEVTYNTTGTEITLVKRCRTPG